MSSSCTLSYLNLGLLEPQTAPVTATDWLVTGGIVLTDTARQYAALLVKVEPEEERH